MLRRVPGAMLAARWLSQAFVELTFVLAPHFAGTFPFLPPAARRVGRKLSGAGARPGRPRQADARLQARLQAPELLQRVRRHFNRDNVLLETTPIEAITPTGVRTADGVEHEIDVLVLATGFKVFEQGNMPPFPSTGPAASSWRSGGTTTACRPTRASACPAFPTGSRSSAPTASTAQSYFGLIETPDAPHRPLPASGPARERRYTRGDHRRGQPPLLGVGARAAAATRSSSRACCATRQQLLLRPARRRSVPAPA